MEEVLLTDATYIFKNTKTRYIKLIVPVIIF
jgi:hypothetical protein